MIKKLYIMLLTALVAGPSAMAEKLTPQQALSRIETGELQLLGASKHTAIRLVDRLEDDNIYVFAQDNTDGFMLVSGDDCVAPVLGYSDSGTFNSDGMPEQMKWLISEYVAQIEFARQHNQTYASRQHIEDVIEPMIKTRWDQGAPYNNMCPSDRRGRCYTGCLATAMAQVMNYWQYPEIGKGTRSFTPSTIGSKLTIDFAEREFDWEAMRDVYVEGEYSDREAEAVAWLMKACGSAVDMGYSSVSSGALSAVAPKALRDYFSYDPKVTYAERMAYSLDEWEAMLVDNLKNCGPILYNGCTQLSGGHAFVCDGYDGNGYFHFNWGWSGESDGYFLLDLLDPESQGIGGAAAGFNFKQNAVLGIRVPDGVPAEEREPRLTQYGSLFATVTGVRTLTFGVENYNPLGWGNSNVDAINLTLGALLEPQGETSGEKLYVESQNYEILLTPGEYYTYETSLTPKVRVPADLAQGTYHMSLVTKNNKSTTGIWSPMIVAKGYNDYVTLVKDENGLSVINQSDPTLAISDAEFESKLVYGRPVTVKATIKNETPYQLTQGVSIVLINPRKFRRFVGEGISVTLAPGETIVKEITSDLYIMAGAYEPENDKEFTLALHNPVTNTYYGEYGAVEMMQEAGVTDVAVDGTEIGVIYDNTQQAIIISGAEADSQVFVYSADGKLVVKVKGNSIDVESLNGGIYIVQVSNGVNKQTTKKIII